MFHIFKDGMFSHADIPDQGIDVHPQHNCSSKTSVSLCCIDSNDKFPYIINLDTLNVGVEHNIKFAHCDCEPLIVHVTFVSYGLLHPSIFALPFV